MHNFSWPSYEHIQCVKCLDKLKDVQDYKDFKTVVSACVNSMWQHGFKNDRDQVEKRGKIRNT